MSVPGGEDRVGDAVGAGEPLDVPTRPVGPGPVGAVVEVENAGPPVRAALEGREREDGTDADGQGGS